MDPPDQVNCHLHGNTLNTLQRTVNNTSEQVLNLQNQVKAYFPSAKPSAETIMSNPFGFNLKEPLQQQVAASLLKLGRHHHETCIPSLVTSLQNIGWKVRMQNWSVSTIQSQLTIATSLSHCISTSSSSFTVPTTIPQSATPSITSHVTGTHGTSSKTVVSTPINCQYSPDVTTRCSCCQDCIDALKSTNMLINNKLAKLNEICTTILNMLNTSIVQKSKLIQHLGYQCDNQIRIERQVSQLMTSGLDGIYACSSVHSTQQNTQLSTTNRTSTPLLPAFNFPSFTSSINPHHDLTKTRDSSNKLPIQRNCTNDQPSTSREKATVIPSERHTPDKPPKLTLQLPVQITIDTPASTPLSPPVLSPQLPIQFTPDTPVSISGSPPVLSPQLPIQFTPDTPVSISGSPPVLSPQLPIQFTPDTPVSISGSPPVLSPQLPIQFTPDTPVSISGSPPVLTPQVRTQSTFDLRDATPPTCNYSKSLKFTLEEHMDRFPKSESSNAYSILQDSTQFQLAAASMSPVISRKRLFIEVDSGDIEQIKVTKRTQSSTVEPIQSLTDYPSLLAGMIVGHSSFKVTDDWPSYKSRQNMVNLWNIKPFYLKRRLDLYTLHMYSLYCGTEKPAYDVTSNKVWQEVLSEVFQSNSSPTFFARDLVWRVLTLKDVYQLHHRHYSFREVMSAVKRATIDKFNITDDFWDTSCIDFINNSNNYFFKNKLRSKVFQMFLRGNLPDA